MLAVNVFDINMPIDKRSFFYDQYINYCDNGSRNEIYGYSCNCEMLK